jgi:hypothetical protein
MTSNDPTALPGSAADAAPGSAARGSAAARARLRERVAALYGQRPAAPGSPGSPS